MPTETSFKEGFIHAFIIFSIWYYVLTSRCLADHRKPRGQPDPAPHHSITLSCFVKCGFSGIGEELCGPQAAEIQLQKTAMQIMQLCQVDSGTSCCYSGSFVFQFQFFQLMALTKRIIPCLDIDGGRVVKGVRFSNLRDAGDPTEVALRYCREGADELAFLDISATHGQRNIVLDVVAKAADQLFIPLTVGGGVRNLDDVRALHMAGADKIAINSAAVANPDLIRQVADKVGRQCVVIAIDAKKNQAENRWEVFTHGGRKPTGIDAEQWAQRTTQDGAGEILLTSMDNDGAQQGFDLALTRRISESVDVPVIASGGVGSAQHMVEGISQGKADAVLAASIFHFGQLSIREVKLAMHRSGLAVRL